MMASGGDPAQATAASPGAVHVIDDEEQVRWAVETLLLSAGIAVESHASGLAFLEALPGLDDGIGCILTDVRMPGMDGLDLLRHLREVGFPRPVVIMTAHGDVSMAVRAMKAGACDFVEKPFDDEAILAIVRAACDAPDGTEAPDATPKGRGAGASPKAVDAAARIATLSPREHEVLEGVVAGKSNKVIAHDLGISHRTVEIHRARLMARLGVRSIAEAVRLAVLAELADGGAEPPAPAGQSGSP